MSGENLQENKISFKELLKKHKFKIIFLISIIFVLIITAIIFNDIKRKSTIEISKSFNSAKINLQKNNDSVAKEIFLKIINENHSFYSPSSLNLIIENELIKSDSEILKLFDKVINNSRLDKETKNLFIYKKTLFIGDKITEAQLLNNLNPIIQSNSIWEKTAKDYIYEYYISRNEFEKAKEFKVQKIN